jgi:hypothetical protein
MRSCPSRGAVLERPFVTTEDEDEFENEDEYYFATAINRP